MPVQMITGAVLVQFSTIAPPSFFDNAGVSSVLADGSKRCSCGAGCPSFGACLRGKRLHVVGGESKAKNYEWDHHLDRYAYAVSQGIQPEGTTVEAVETAIAVSRATDTPYRADL